MSQVITKRSLADEVAARLRERLYLGAYQVDEKLPIEPELMKQFGVGRSTVREAIKLLVNSGLLRVQQGVGTFVARVSPGNEPIDQRLNRADKAELDEVRQLLEMKIAEKAAKNRSSADIEEIKTHLTSRAEAIRQDDLNGCIEADVRFHTAIAVASGNAILSDLYKLTSTHLENFFKSSYTETTRFRKSQKLHADLLEHIIAQNAKEAWKTASEIVNEKFN